MQRSQSSGDLMHLCRPAANHAMSGLGHFRKSGLVTGMSDLPAGADIVRLHAQVRFAPISKVTGLHRWIRGLEPGGALRFNR
jgi:hypothetical protein